MRTYYNTSSYTLPTTPQSPPSKKHRSEASDEARPRAIRPMQKNLGAGKKPADQRAAVLVDNLGPPAVDMAQTRPRRGSRARRLLVAALKHMRERGQIRPAHRMSCEEIPQKATNLGEDHQEDKLVWGKQVQNLLTLVIFLRKMHAPSNLRDCRARNRNPGVLACADKDEAGLNGAVEGFARERMFLGSKVGWNEVIWIIGQGYRTRPWVGCVAPEGRQVAWWRRGGGIDSVDGNIRTRSIRVAGDGICRGWMSGGRSKKTPGNLLAAEERKVESQGSGKPREPIWAEGRVEKSEYQSNHQMESTSVSQEEKSQRGSQREGGSRKKPNVSAAAEFYRHSVKKGPELGFLGRHKPKVSRTSRWSCSSANDAISLKENTALGPLKDDDIHWESKATGWHRQPLAPPRRPSRPTRRPRPSRPAPRCSLCRLHLPPPPRKKAYLKSGRLNKLEHQAMMRTTPTFWFRTAFFWRDYPHTHLSSAMKRYYVVQIGYWVQQWTPAGLIAREAADTRSGLRDLDVGDGCGCAPVAPCGWASRKVEARVLLLGLEKHRSDYWEYMVHHVVTVWMVSWSYLMNVTLLGTAVFESMDVPDFLLACVARVTRLPPRVCALLRAGCPSQRVRSLVRARKARGFTQGPFNISPGSAQAREDEGKWGINEIVCTTRQTARYWVKLSIGRVDGKLWHIPKENR
ncbi:hypothetical protein C8F04DRAFT_1233457 [Mycena alexandri]|uniref:TLC domain-containing protein n=1 Tax=Mycena alexandri TaxID=1745969 RepID=A0AAD6SXC0_9AGAR|nr:hypothetical protein C8F04DRAFT_1233457 [Mycena alexandri]